MPTLNIALDEPSRWEESIMIVRKNVPQAVCHRCFGLALISMICAPSRDIQPFMYSLL